MFLIVTYKFLFDKWISLFRYMTPMKIWEKRKIVKKTDFILTVSSWIQIATLIALTFYLTKYLEKERLWFMNVYLLSLGFLLQFVQNKI